MLRHHPHRGRREGPVARAGALLRSARGRPGASCGASCAIERGIELAPATCTAAAATCLRTPSASSRSRSTCSATRSSTTARAASCGRYFDETVPGLRLLVVVTPARARQRAGRARRSRRSSGWRRTPPRSRAPALGSRLRSPRKPWAVASTSRTAPRRGLDLLPRAAAPIVRRARRPTAPALYRSPHVGRRRGAHPLRRGQPLEPRAGREHPLALARPGADPGDAGLAGARACDSP